MGDNIKQSDIHAFGVPEGEESEIGTEKIFQERMLKTP